MGAKSIFPAQRSLISNRSLTWSRWARLPIWFRWRGRTAFSFPPVSSSLINRNVRALWRSKRCRKRRKKSADTEVGFQFAPRLNAAGRLETAESALRLLLARDLAEAMPLAQELDLQNRERQKIEKTIVEEVIATVRAKFDAQADFVIVEGQLLWHIGVVGIVASRVLQEFYRPTIIIGGENGEMRGSGRSIAGFDLAAALGECHELLLRHGGHAMAAGYERAAGQNRAVAREVE